MTKLHAFRKSTAEQQAFYAFVGARLRRLRQEKGLTQKELAGLAGLTEKTIQGIESGYSCSLYQLNEVSLALDMTPGAFVPREDP